MTDPNAPVATQRGPGDLVIVVLFAVLLLVPAALAVTGHAGFDVDFLLNTEQRKPFVAPPVTSGALATGGWQRDAEREIADAFPLRRQLITGYDYAKYVWLGDVGSTSVIRGRDGWLFYGAEERDYLEGKPTDADLAHAAAVYAERSAWCARRGIPYVFVLVPNKSTIYPQYLPQEIRRPTATAVDRLLPLLRARGVHVVDTRQALLDASRHGEVYTRGDTHWNDAGAYAAYRVVVAALQRAHVPIHDKIAPSSIVARQRADSGDLLRLAGVANAMTNQWLDYDFPHRAHEITALSYPNDPDAAAFGYYTSAVDDPSRPKIVAFGDSFLAGLRPFLAEDARRFVALDHHSVQGPQFDRAAVAAERPNVVIQELVERSLVFAGTFSR
jgi:alginate O-acetyltransferase complex protein AlgJ